MRTPSARVRAAAPTDVFVLDFDGVIIDSEPELSASALRFAQQYWPAAFADASPAHLESIREGMRLVRPTLVAGYEAVILARLLSERPGAGPELLTSWSSTLPALEESWQLDVQDLKSTFEKERTGWMEGETAAWLQQHVPYPGVRESLRGCDAPYYLASSKAPHRISSVLSGVMGVDIPPDSPRMFAGLVRPDEDKVAALRTIGERPVCASARRLHFVDDRWQTLRVMLDSPGLDRWQLYMADWGYNGEEEREQARRSERVTLLSLRSFNELLRWGLLSGVDDGCEPTTEEVKAGVTGGAGDRTPSA